MDHVTASPPSRLLSSPLLPRFIPYFFSLDALLPSLSLSFSLIEHDSANGPAMYVYRNFVYEKKKKEKKKGVGTGFLSILIRLPCQYFRSTIHSSGSSPSFRSISIFLLLLLPDLRLNCTR